METGKGIEKAINKEECEVMIPSLKEDGRNITTKREHMLERYAESYRKLCEDTVHNIAKMETEEVPSILITEEERAFSQMKSIKALGEDQIVVEIIKAGGEVALRKIRELFNAVLR